MRGYPCSGACGGGVVGGVEIGRNGGCGRVGECGSLSCMSEFYLLISHIIFLELPRLSICGEVGGRVGGIRIGCRRGGRGCGGRGFCRFIPHAILIGSEPGCVNQYFESFRALSEFLLYVFLRNHGKTGAYFGVNFWQS